MPLPDTTLHVLGVSHGCHMNVDVSLTVRDLDDRGFVVDTVAFIKSVQARVASTTAEVAENVIKVGKELAGERLVRMSTEIRNSKQRTLKNWPERAVGIASPNDLRTVLYQQRIPAQLHSESVCGGYDGTFLCDLVVSKHDDDQRWRDFAHYVAKRFNRAQHKASCEQLAQGVCHMACNNTPDIMFVRARVYNETGYAEVLWHEGLAIPPFPRITAQLLVPCR
jgi:hypothetical protein